jgi:haloalkane dehalogenase
MLPRCTAHSGASATYSIELGSRMQRATILTTVSLLFVSPLALSQSAAAPEGMTQRANLRNVRYCEFLVVKRHGMSATASVFNTLGLNDCPQEQWAEMDPVKLQKELKVTRVVLNGPRYFTMDRNALRAPGRVENFDGMQARLLAELEVHSQKRIPYTDNTVARDSQYVYDKGKPVYELIAPDGHAYIMQSYSLEVDKTLNEQALNDLGNRLKLPKGWKYRPRILDDDLVLQTAGTAAKATVLQDDLKNSYQRE